jgi:hypothetical protein
MRPPARVLTTGALGLALGIGLLVTDAAGAADEKEIRAAVQQIADAIAKKDDAGARKQAEGLAKKVEEIYEVMDLMALRKGAKGGLGIGPKPGAVTPDGIERKFIELSKKPLPQGQLDKEAADLARAAYIAAAIAEVAHAKVPARDDGMKKRKDWLQWSKDMREGAARLAETAQTKKAADVKAAAVKLNSACNECHGVFR